MLPYLFQMQRGPVPLVDGKAIVGIKRIKRIHETVTGHLRHDRGGGDAHRQGVTFFDSLIAAGEITREQALGKGLLWFDEPERGLPGIVDAAALPDRPPQNESSILVRSPMVGMFYISPSPDEDPFVKVGQEVLSGQTLAIVEAMKMMNEITTPAPGIVMEVLAANGSQVEYDQPLFRIATGDHA